MAQTRFLFSIKSRFIVVFVFLVALVSLLVGHLLQHIFYEQGGRDQILLLGAIIVLSVLFFVFLIKDFVVPVWRMIEQLLAVARLSGQNVETTEMGLAQATLKDLFVKMDHNTHTLRITSAQAARRLAAIELSHDGVCMVDAKGMLIYANKSFRSFHDVPETFEQDDIAWLDLYSGKAREKLKNSCLVMLQQDGFWYGETETDNAKYVCELSLTMLENGGFICNERDITERKKIEAEKEHLQNLFNQAQKMEAVGQLTGGVAHDFNNMLAVILGNLDLLEDDLPNEPQLKKFLAASKRAAYRAAELTQRLLSFSRRQVLSPQLIKLSVFMGDAETLIARALNEKIHLSLKVPDTIWPLNADAGQLENALLNLVINARDAMPDGGTITIRAENVMVEPNEAAKFDVNAGAYVKLCLQDTGQGIPPEMISRIFEPFFTTKGIGKGTGLGLSMVYGFIKQSGGFLNVESTEGQGTEIQMYLPRYEMIATQSPGITKRMLDNKASRQGTVVVAEDDPDVLDMTQERLRRMGYDLHLATTGMEAIEIFATLGSVDLLLTDIRMPGGMDGFDLARKALGKYPDLKILFLSGYLENSDVFKAFPQGQVRYLAKPYTQQKLSEEIETLMK